MVFDTDVFVWVQRGNRRAAALVQNAERRCISIFTYMEFLQGCRDKLEFQRSQQFLRDFDFETLPLTPNIGHRASIYVEQFALSHGMRAGDAVIAATAAEFGLTLCSANSRHFKQIPGLELKVLKP